MGCPVAVLAMMGWALLSAGDLPTVTADPTLAIIRDGDSLLIRRGSQTLLRYRFLDVPFKPYVQEWYSPSGVNLLRDSPFDHKHHHALMFAVKVDGVNFWEEQEAPGTQVHQAFDLLEIGLAADTTCARIVQRLNWVNPGSGDVLLQETRTITVYDTPAPALLTWESRFTLPPGKDKATLGGAHYHGLGMRFVESMDTVGTFILPEGELGELVRGDEHLTPAPWCAYTAPAGGHAVTVALFDAPENVRPALWFTMKEHFAYLSATVNLGRDPLEVTPDKPLVLRYGAALWDAAAEKAEIEDGYRRWLKLSASKEH